MEDLLVLLVIMVGRIKTKKIKRDTQKIFGEIKDQLTGNYDENKKIVTQKYDIQSKKLRNIISGYCTRLKKGEN